MTAMARIKVQRQAIQLSSCISPVIGVHPRSLRHQPWRKFRDVVGVDGREPNGLASRTLRDGNPGLSWNGDERRYPGKSRIKKARSLAQQGIGSGARDHASTMAKS
jgi:hypothetical protein